MFVFILICISVLEKNLISILADLLENYQIEPTTWFK